MKRLLSINSLLQAITGLMAVALVVTFAISAKSAWERRLSAERVLAVASISSDLFQAMQNLRVERGTVNTALSTAAVVSAETKSDIAALRAKSDKALASALAKLTAASLQGTGAQLAALRDAREAITKMRQAADAALLQAKEQRPADLSKNWIAAVGKLVDAIDRLSDRLAADITSSDPFIAQMMAIKQLAWAVRDAAGTDRLTIGALIANGKGVSVEQQKKLAVFEGRIASAWKIIAEDVAEPAAPAQLKAAVAAAKQSYFTALAEKRKAILTELLADKPASISGGEWVKFSNPGLKSLIDVANAAFDLSEDYAGAQVAAAVRNCYLQLFLTLLFLSFGIFTTLFVIRRIARPMALITEAMRRGAQGELLQAIPYESREDEIGELARALAIFRDNAAEKSRIEAAQRDEQERKEQRQRAIEQQVTAFERSVRSLLEALAQAAVEMRSTSEGMSATAEETDRQASAVNTAAEHASANVQTVATASEELTSSIAEIARQVTQAAAIAGQAVAETRTTDDTVQSLAEKAQRIGEVVQLINDIASQTNLLALNATIEAARAGEAGKGFAVVASEVKSLATQTAKATEDITAQVTAIQQATKSAVEAIKTVGRIIGDVNEISASIASAVEEQGAATQEITRNTQEAARGTHDVSANIAGVSEGAGMTGKAAESVLTAAGELSRMSERLKSEVDNFLASIRAA